MNVMDVDEMVDAALAGFDQGEIVTVPSLPDAGEAASRQNAQRFATETFAQAFGATV